MAYQAKQALKHNYYYQHPIMTLWQHIIAFGFALAGLSCAAVGFYQSKYRRNPFGLTRWLFFLGIFVWGDAVVLGLFWALAGVVSWVLQDWNLFLLTVSLFWLVRSMGETSYWLNQQFSSLNRNPVKNLPWHSVFHDESIWFIHQIVWQCVTVVAAIFTIYFSRQWWLQL